MENKSLLEKERKENSEIVFSDNEYSEGKNIKSKLSNASRNLGLVCAFLMPLYAFFVMEYMHFGTFGNFAYYLKNFTGSAIFSLLMLYGIYTIVWMLIKKGFLAALILSIVSFTLAIGNYFKHSLTGDFVYPWDIVNQTGNVKELLSFIKGGLPLTDVLLIFFGVILLVLIFSARPQIRVRIAGRIAVLMVICAAMILPFKTPDRISKTLSVFNMKRESTATQETNHFEHGFTGGFMVNALSMKVTKPNGYSEEEINRIMTPYQAKEAMEKFNSPDVIVILSESFWDPKLIPDTKFSKNPIKNYEAIAKRENARSGNMYVTATGGGTVKTEFDVLTGLTVEQLPAGAVPWQYVNFNIPSYPSHYKELGYRTVFLHTYLPSFYLRSSAYPYIGFDEIYFEEELTAIEEIKWEQSGMYISDDSFVDYVEYLLDKDSQKPCFLFGISMENHQPYENKYQEFEVEVDNPYLSEEAITYLKNYTTGVYNSDLALKKLVDYIDKREKDTLLVYFGDHLPTLGQNRAAYVESGFISSSSELTKEESHKFLRTPFLIYGNFNLCETGMLKKGETNELSTYNLLNAATEVIGAPKTAYMEFLRGYFDDVPFYNDYLQIEWTPRIEELKYAHRMITYDVLKGNRYSLK